MGLTLTNVIQLAAIEEACRDLEVWNAGGSVPKRDGLLGIQDGEILTFRDAVLGNSNLHVTMSITWYLTLVVHPGQ